jgi:two-component system nitrogen regulation response regulator NtrX
MPSVLIIDDETNIRRMVGALLTSEGFEVRDAPDGLKGMQMAEEQEPDVVVMDLMMPGGPDGIAILEKMKARYPNLPVVMMSGRAGLSDAVRATKLGAAQFLEKPLTPEGLLLALQACMELRQARLEAISLRSDLGLDDEMVGTSTAMQSVRKLIAQVAPSDARVLINGESGTGKELAAAAIHLGSARSNRPFVRVNCAAIPRDLVESEMFGHERGAFTGATERRIGRFELANKGTLFLDEVGDLHLEAQAKLLRAIESSEIERLGGGKPLRIDVRIVAATNKDLQRAVASGVFREDLLFRLNVIPISLPPLRERPTDIAALVAHFNERYYRRSARPAPRWSAEAMSLLLRYSWPGNVRELANIVERLAILHAGAAVEGADVHAVLTLETSAPDPDTQLPNPEQLDVSLTDNLDEYERVLIRRALSVARGNVAEAARRLQTDRPNLYRRMKRLGLVDNDAS